MLGKGTAIAITDRDIALLADRLGAHPADLEAISIVESGGFGWFKDGRIKILFEKHWMYKLTPAGAVRAQAVAAGVARKAWISPKKGGYKDQDTADQRYSLLATAIGIYRAAAFAAISVGRFQIMGFNAALCGFKDAEQMFALFCESEAHQLGALANFLIAKKLTTALRTRDFAKIESVYNGGGLGGAYAVKMRDESDALRAGKWKNYKAGTYAPEKVAPVPHARPGTKAPGDASPAPANRWAWLGALIAAIVAALKGMGKK
jgi:hypothetical protein